MHLDLGRATAASPSSPRSSLQLLTDRNFGVLFWGKLASLVASWAMTIVVIILTFEATGSAAWAGVMTAAQLGPQLLLAMVSGRLADSHGPVLQIVVGGILSSFGALGLAGWMVWLSASDGTLTPLPLVVSSAAFGTGLALSAPSMHSIVPRLVIPRELSSAVSLNFFPTALARTVGPAGGTLIAAVFGPVASLVVMGLVFLTSSVLFCFIHLLATSARQSESDSSIFGALRYVGSDRVLVVLLVGVAAIGAGSEPAITLAPLLAEMVGHADEGAGWVVSFFGAGGLFGVFAHRLLSVRLSPAVEGCVAMAGLAVAMAVAGLGISMVVLGCALVLGGLFMVVGITAFSVGIQQRCKRSMLGRVMALWVLAFAGIRPLAGLLQGLVSDHVSTRAAIEGSALVLLAAIVLVGFVLRPSGARLSEPD